MADPNSLHTLASIDAPASMDSWELFNGFVAEQAQHVLGEGKSGYQLRLACEELFSNIIRHATCQDSQPGCAHLWVRALRQRNPQPALVIELQDNGQPFDPHFEQARSIDTAQALEDRPIGGLGLFLVQRSVDRVEYARIGGHNRYRLFVDIPAG